VVVPSAYVDGCRRLCADELDETDVPGAAVLVTAACLSLTASRKVCRYLQVRAGTRIFTSTVRIPAEMVSNSSSTYYYTSGWSGLDVAIFRFCSVQVTVCRAGGKAGRIGLTTRRQRAANGQRVAAQRR
jgi:hypothetical protein